MIKKYISSLILAFAYWLLQVSEKLEDSHAASDMQDVRLDALEHHPCPECKGMKAVRPNQDDPKDYVICASCQGFGVDPAWLFSQYQSQMTL